MESCAGLPESASKSDASVVISVGATYYLLQFIECLDVLLQTVCTKALRVNAPSHAKTSCLQLQVPYYASL